MKPPYIIVGLGNPGLQYDKSRHNAGFCVIDSLADLMPIENIKKTSRYILAAGRVDSALIHLVKPLVYMNLSGEIIAEILKKSNGTAANLLAVCDNMDLELGKLKLKSQGGSAGQKGLQNIIDKLGTNRFNRLFVGIGRPQKEQTVPDYVLNRFPAHEEPLFLQVCKDAANFLLQLPSTPFERLQGIVKKYDRANQPPT